MKALLIILTITQPAYAQMQYQYVPNSPEWPTFNTPQLQVPTTQCVLVNSYQNTGQQYPSTSYQVCN